MLLLKVWKKILKMDRNLQYSLKRSNYGIGSEGEGNGGGVGEDEPTDLDMEPSDFEGEEEYQEEEEDEEMADPNLEWMTQGPLALPGVFHKMPK